MSILLDLGPSERGFSRVGTFLRCPQLYAYKYVLKLQETGAKPALALGSLIHVGLAHFYARIGAEQGGVVIDDAVAPDGAPCTLPGCHVVTDTSAFFEPGEAIEMACARHPAWEEHKVQAYNCIRRYQLDRMDDGRRWRIIAVERPASIALPSGGRISSRIDLEVYEENVGYLVVDHKSTGYISAKTLEYYSRHGQFHLLHAIGVQTYGAEFAGTRANLVQTDGEKFRLSSLEYVPHARDCFLQRIALAEERIADLEERTLRGALSPWEWPAADHELACYHRYGRCDAWELCAFGPAALEK